MRRKNNKLRYILFISIMVSICSIFIKNQNVGASIPYDQPTIFPTGLKFSDYFANGTVSGNDANPNYATSNGNAIQITGPVNNKKGFVWSNPEKLNYFNLNEKQTLSMWIYLGDQDNPGDGLAFVLQNYGLNASSLTKDGKVGSGQTMGVWGTDDDYTNSSSTIGVASKAIQNSWALEFDTYKNPLNSGASMFKNGSIDGIYNFSGNSSFDSLLNNVSSSDSHIAYNYPAEPTTYEQHSDSTATTTVQLPIGSYTKRVQTYWYTMKHSGLKTTPENSSKGLKLSNGMWHHLTFSYRPPETGNSDGLLSYVFDDKVLSADKSITDVKEPVSGSNIPIDTDEFYKNSHQQFSKSDGKVLWGFTGSTGDNVARNMVKFESIPSLVEGSADASIYDESQADKELSSSDDTVYNGDNLKLVYNVKRDSGELDWKDINATINLPKDVNYTGGKIVYNNGDTVNIDDSELSSGTFTKPMQDLLKTNEPGSATITINGVANSSTPSKDDKINSTTADFEGSNLIKNIDLQGFTIKATTMNLTPDTTTLDIGSKTSIDANSTISYIDTSIPLDNSKITAHYKLNDNSEKTQTLSSGNDGKLSIKVNRNDLNDGDNTLTVYVTDTDGNRSSSVTYNINKPTKAPILIDAGTDMSFKTINQSGEKRIVKRNGNWKVNVVDNQNTTNWKLTATAIQDPSSSKLDGDLLYVDDNGISKSILNGSVIQIADKSDFPSNFISDGTTYQVANTWNDNDGILLQTNSEAKAGTYKYDVTWDLTDSI
ncbi:hypothetical protein [Companilactobacillus insicii]|uniref:hypothetical protein n=1 Tax=Companilactobacillus insicii TaxID=1732567 RepID=UPI000F7A180B|nr:hypothetical protein [Companilactobacillus insicii]